MKFKHTNIHEDLDYRDHVVENHEEYVNDFLNVFSKPILQYIGEKIRKVTPVEIYSLENRASYRDYAMPLIGEYYMFIAAKHPGQEKDGELPIESPQWNALRKYSAENGCTLYSYINTITVRNFLKTAVQSNPPEKTATSIERSKGKNHEDIITHDETFDFIAKVYYDQEYLYDDLGEEIKNDLRKALNDLKEITIDPEKESNNSFKFDGTKDFRVLELCCMYDYKWDDIADELKDYFKVPFSGPLQDISDKEKKSIQTRIAQWKKRAIEHFTDLIYKSNRYKYLNSAIIQHRINRKSRIS